LRSEWTTFWESFQPSFCVLLGNFHISSTFLSWILSSILHPFIYVKFVISAHKISSRL
jgi:hypothetical protein